MVDIVIGGKPIGIGHPPFIIAELSANHNQSLDRAIALIDAAAEAGVSAVKIQTFKPESMTLDSREGPFLVGESQKLWSGRNLFDLYKEAATPYDWHPRIFARCREKGIICFSTPFDEEAVELLEKLDCPCYKVASFENGHIPLIRRLGRTGKPVIISTGMATLSEIEEAITALRAEGCDRIVLLKCTSNYPADPEFSNLRTIPHMAELFNVPIGLSDHTPGIGVPIAAVALGAKAVEKHLTLSRQDGGVDAAFSLEPLEMKALVDETLRAWRALGEVHYGPTSPEIGSRTYRRSIYVCKDIRAGDTFSPENIRIIRPSGGLEPKVYPLVIGKNARKDMKAGQPLTWQELL